jgi:hypothetical protein
MHWKRQQHAARGTALVETTSFGLRSGHALQDLAERLGASGVELDPNPDRELPDQGAKPMPDADLIGLMRTFIAHAKSNCLTLDDMAARLRQMPEDQFKERTGASWKSPALFSRPGTTHWLTSAASISKTCSTWRPGCWNRATMNRPTNW